MLTRPADNGPGATVLCMRHSSLVLGALAIVAAPVAGVMAYQSWAPTPNRAVDPAAASSFSTGSSPDPVFRYRPCLRPARLELGVCVTHRVRVVVATPADARAPLSNAVPSSNDPDPIRPSDHASPTHPVHHPPTHVTDPTDDPTGDQTGEPTVEPSAPPTCESSDDGDDDRVDTASDRTGGGGPLAWMADSGGAQVVTQSDEGTPNTCQSEDEGDEGDDEGDDEADDDEDDDGGLGGVGAD